MTDFLIADLEAFKFGKGNIIQGNCSVSCDVEFGDYNVFNGSVAFGHDTKVGNYNTFMPGTRISGEVHIGDENAFWCRVDCSSTDKDREMCPSWGGKCFDDKA